MSSILSFGMPSSKKEKHYANSRARRHSGDVVISQSKKSKKDDKKEKDTDTESISSSTPSSTAETVVAPPPEPKKCPLRFMITGMLEAEPEVDGKKSGGCPLRRVQLWHIIPLCLLAAVNLILIIIALLGMAGYKIGAGVWGWLAGLFKNDDPDFNPFAQSLIDIDDGPVVAESEKQ